MSEVGSWGGLKRVGFFWGGGVEILFAARSFADIGQSMRTSVLPMGSVVHDGNGCHDAILNCVATHTKKITFRFVRVFVHGLYYTNNSFSVRHVI